MSSYCVMTDEAVKEVNDILNSKDHYLTLDNSFAFSLDAGPISTALQYLTKR